MIRDIDRQVRDDPYLNSIFRPAIGKGKAHKPYEFGVKVSVATTVSAPRGGQFVLAAKALPGNPMTGRRFRP
jgi:hypothetical protein